tara:strand:- start:1631 stop:2788 length:1158 start_codon:yes stop_codon:yes gene_type:complete
MEQEGGGFPAVGDEPQMPRMSDFPVDSVFSKLDQRLGFIDSWLFEVKYSISLVMRYWGAREGAMAGLVIAGFFLGTWDLGIGEISSGGDFNRWGILGGERSGFLHMKDMALILALLSIICWAVFVMMLWSSFPIMKENMVYLLVGMAFIQFGYIKAHAENPDFPWEAGFSGPIWVIASNLVMLFLSNFVVRRAVVETRDVHVQRKHSHPDPRVIERAWKDHSLGAWSIFIGLWILLLNISFWSSTHSIAPSPGELEFSYSLAVIHFITGVLATLILIFIVWFPEFMLGSSETRIQSSRAREVAGEAFEPEKSEQGKCPLCNQKTSAIKNAEGKITVPCNSDGCSGNGVTGSDCGVCGSRIPSRVVCVNCGSNTPVGGHFGRVESW